MRNTDSPSRDRLVDTKEAAVMLSKHPAVLADWRHQKRGPKYVKFGKSVRYRISDLIDWIVTYTVEPGAEGGDES